MLVLPIEATRELVLTDAQVAWVPPREVSGLVKMLDRHQEKSSNGQHLKRVHKALRMPSLASHDDTQQASSALQASQPSQSSQQPQQLLAILLCLGNADEGETLAPAVQAVLKSCGACIRTVRVPQYAPATRPQFEEANRVWPVHFHEGAATRSLAVWRDAPAPHELPSMQAHMRRAIAAARDNAAAGGRPVAAVMVRRRAAATGDGSTSTGAASSGLEGGVDEDDAACVVAVCADGTCSAAAPAARSPGHPLAHACMRCVEEVARQERAYAARKRAAGAYAAAGGATAAAAGDEAVAAADDGPAAFHLCAACDLFLTHEPCAMCAMALVHSRVRRVIYALACPGGGALGSRYRLHCERSLNHHFTVLGGMLAHEAREAGLARGDALGCGG